MSGSTRRTDEHPAPGAHPRAALRCGVATLLASLVLVAAGCLAAPGHHVSCSHDADCRSGSTCVSGTCVAGTPDPTACGTDADCAAFAGSVCQGGHCAQSCFGVYCAPDQVCGLNQTGCLAADGRPCSADGQCPLGFGCLPLGSQRFCLRQCNQTADCLPGYTCQADASGTGHRCDPDECGPAASDPSVQTSDLGAADGCAVTGGKASQPGTCIGPTVPTGDLVSGHDGLCYQDGTQGLGAVCDAGAVFGDGSAQCTAGLVCQPPLALEADNGSAPAGDDTCMQLCGAASGHACAAGARCWQLWADLGVCVAQQAGGAAPLPAGSACTRLFDPPTSASTSHRSYPDVRDCVEGAICVGRSTGTCRTACNTSTNDCPTGDACASLSDAAHPDLGYCVPP